MTMMQRRRNKTGNRRSNRRLFFPDWQRLAFLWVMVVAATFSSTTTTTTTCVVQALFSSFPQKNEWKLRSTPSLFVASLTGGSNESRGGSSSDDRHHQHHNPNIHHRLRWVHNIFAPQQQQQPNQNRPPQQQPTTTTSGETNRTDRSGFQTTATTTATATSTAASTLLDAHYQFLLSLFPTTAPSNQQHQQQRRVIHHPHYNTNSTDGCGRSTQESDRNTEPLRRRQQSPWWKAAAASIRSAHSSLLHNDNDNNRWSSSSSSTTTTVSPSTTTTTTTTTAAPPQSATRSVHLKLNPQPPQPKLSPPENKNNKDDDENNNSNNEAAATSAAPPAKNSTTMVKVHTFVHPRTGKTYKAINTPKSKFLAFLTYSDPFLQGTNAGAISTQEHVWETTTTTRGEPQPPQHQRQATFSSSSSSSQQQQQVEQKRLLKEWRMLWERQRLITDRTEFLAVYPSDVVVAATKTKHGKNNNNNNNGAVVHKRGGFADLLHLYRERIVAILKDEKEDYRQQRSLVTWLEQNYGHEKVDQLKAANFRHCSSSKQLSLLKEFLEWFRSTFPYYYDRCGTCGASLKEDPVPATTENDDDDDDDEHDSSSHTFMGYVYPGADELKGKASRTELYKCHKCNSWTRFPRYNSAWHVMNHKRGRCGEYSLLLFRFLRALNHEARWVVDWADHVWAEVKTDSLSWVHLDPCEAAVNENLIYEGWGKKQVYILAFYAPSRFRKEGWLLQPSQPTTPIIEDVTTTYTSDSEFKIQQRRDEPRSTVVDAISDAIVELESTLTKL